MPDFNVRSDSVNVEQIMEQIRARIREKRGVDYTEQQLREMAAVKLEKFLDPRGVRSDLLEQFKRRQPPAAPSFTFDDTTIYETHRGVLRFIRRLLNPILKLLFNPNPIIHALHTQANLNDVLEKRRLEIDALYYEVIHNLVFEMTRLGIDTKNVKMRVESIASRLEFNERRARALESVVAYRASSEGESERETRDEPAPAPRPQPSARPQHNQGGWTPSASSSPAAGAGPGAASDTVPPTAATPAGQPPSGAGQPGTEGPGQRSRRRRRRRGRRGGAPAVAVMGAMGPGQPSASTDSTQETIADGPQPADTHAEASPATSDEPARAPESTGPGTDTDPQ
jgi:hypothetical protein